MSKDKLEVSAAQTLHLFLALCDRILYVLFIYGLLWCGIVLSSGRGHVVKRNVWRKKS